MATATTDTVPKAPSGLYIVRRNDEVRKDYERKDALVIRHAPLPALETVKIESEEQMMRSLKSLSATRTCSVLFLFSDGSEKRFNSHVNEGRLTIRCDGECRRIAVGLQGGFVEEGAVVPENCHIGRFVVIFKGAIIEENAVVMGPRTLRCGMVAKARDPDMDIWP